MVKVGGVAGGEISVRRGLEFWSLMPVTQALNLPQFEEKQILGSAVMTVCP